MILNKNGRIAESLWFEIPYHFQYVLLKGFIVMPNHIHGVIHVVVTGHDLSLRQEHSKYFLSTIIGLYKSAVSKLIHKNGFLEFKWQRSFHDHIIVNKKELFKIQKYIKYNPLIWSRDRNNK